MAMGGMRANGPSSSASTQPQLAGPARRGDRRARRAHAEHQVTHRAGHTPRCRAPSAVRPSGKAQPKAKPMAVGARIRHAVR